MRSRSAWCVAAATAGLAIGVAACGGSDDTSGGGAASSGSSSKPSGTVNVSTWGGVWTDGEKKEFGDPFAKDSGVKVNYQVSGNSPMAPALLQAQSGNVKLDVIDAENAEVLRSKNLLADFPPDLMNTIKQTSRPDAYKPYVLNLGSTATMIACNPDVMKKCPTNPQEFFDTKNFPGPRAITNTSYSAMQFALEADGVPADQVYPMDIDRAIKKLDQIKPSVKVWPSSGAEQQQVLIDKEVGAAIMWNGRAFVVKRDNIPNLKMYWDGSTVSQSDGLVVLKDAPNKAGAFAYIKWIAEHAQNQADWTKSITYPTPTKDLLNLVPKDIAAALPAAHDVNQQDDKWISDNTTQLQKAWQGFLAG
jgi:putative spermidine/putrescine transport system substrate-binding protein